MTTVPSATPMRRRRRRRLFLGLLAGFMGLTMLVLALLPYLISLQSIKGPLVSQLQAALHRHVDIGTIRLHILTGLGASLQDVRIGNPPGWPPQHFLTIGRLAVRVAFLPLLQGKIEITRMLVQHGDILIERDAAGHLNVGDLVASKPTGAPVPTHTGPRAPPTETTPAPASPLARLLVSDIALDGINVTFVDRTATSGEVVSTTVREIRGHLHDLSRTTPMPFDVTASWLTDSSHNVRVRGTIGPMPTSLDTAGVPLEAHVQAADVLVAHLTPYLGQRFPLSQGRLGADAKLRGDVDGQLHIMSTLALTDAAMRAFNGGVREVGLPKLTSTQDLTLELPSASLKLTEVQLHLNGLQVTLAGSVSDMRTTPQVDLRLATNAFAPEDLLAHVPLLTAVVPGPIDLRGQTQLQATLTGTPAALHSTAQLAVSHLTLTSGSSPADSNDGGGIRVETDTAHVSFTTDLQDAHPLQIHMDLRAQRLDFDHSRAKTPAPARTPRPTPTGQAPPATSRLPPVAFTGTVAVDEGRWRNLHFQRLAADMTLANDRFTSTQQAHLYGGSYQGTMRINLAQPEPDYAWDANVAGVKLGEMLAAFTPAHNLLAGVLTAQIKLTGWGLTGVAISHSLAGDGTVHMTDLIVNPSGDMSTQSREVIIITPLGRITTHIEIRPHKFNTVDGRFHISQGRIFSDHLQLSGRDLMLSVKGYVGLLDRTLDYNGQLVLSGQQAAAHGLLAAFLRDRYGRIILPFSVKGTISHPKIEVNAQDLWRGRLLP